MKQLLLILASVLALSANAQDLDKKIARAFTSGNVDFVFANIDSEIDLSIDGSRERVGKEQAAEQLELFFGQLSWPKFTQIHKSDRRDAGFIIGNLQVGQTIYRVNISFNKVDGVELIQTIRIEKNK